MSGDAEDTPPPGSPVEPPDLSYVIWYTGRSGSNLLCDALRFTAAAGNPEQYFSPIAILNLFSHYGVSSHAEVQQEVWRRGTTAGVFGMKCQMMNPVMSHIIAALRAFPGGEAASSEAALWANAFPGCRHIYLTRRNKVRQAVSKFRATMSREWTREPGSPPPVQDVADLYQAGHIQRYMLETVMSEAMMADFFSTNGIRPHVVVYEDFHVDIAGTVAGIFEFLGIDRVLARRSEPILKRQADELSEEWVQRFREEQQQGWNRRW